MIKDIVSFLIVLFGGWCGLHKFIEKKKGIGFVYLFTFGLFGFGWAFDIFKSFFLLYHSVQSKINSDAHTATLQDDSAEIVFTKEFLIVGTEYECRKNPKIRRNKIIAEATEGMPVNIEKYLYQGTPAYMVTNPKSGLDLGVLSRGAAQWLSSDYPNCKITGVLGERYNDTYRVKIFVLR